MSREERRGKDAEGSVYRKLYLMVGGVTGPQTREPKRGGLFDLRGNELMRVKVRIEFFLRLVQEDVRPQFVVRVNGDQESDRIGICGVDARLVGA